MKEKKLMIAPYLHMDCNLLVVLFVSICYSTIEKCN